MEKYDYEDKQCPMCYSADYSQAEYHNNRILRTCRQCGWQYVYAHLIKAEPEQQEYGELTT